MTSVKQRSANPVNAKYSTGPRSDVGKARSSQNATQHGLSIPLQNRPDDPVLAATEALIELDGFDESRAAAIALALEEYCRVQLATKSIYFADKAAGDENTPISSVAMSQLLGLRRYQRLAAAQLSKAICRA